MNTLGKELFGPALQQDDTRQGTQTRDALSEAHKAQLLMDLMFAAHQTPRHYGPGVHVEVQHNPVNQFASAQSDGPAGFAQNIADMQGTVDLQVVDTPEKVDGLLDIFRAMDMEQEPDQLEQPSDTGFDDSFGTGVTTDPELDFLSTPPGMLPAIPQQAAAQTDQFTGFSSNVLNPLADMLRPDIADISRLGGGFSGYTEPDRMLERIRQLVRQL